LKAKKTASMIRTNDTMWFHRNVSVLKTVMTMVVKTVRETASCITFNWMRLNGPPLTAAPIRLAGIMNEYSNKAMPHDIRMTKTNGQSFEEGTISINLSCPYQAKVMKTLETMSNKMVYNPFIGRVFLLGSKNNVFLGATAVIIPIFAQSKSNQ